MTAVNDVTFSVGKGEVLGFLGPNGAGKSTTMKMITGFLRPDRGTVDIGGDRMSTRPVEAKRRMGYLPEGAPLYGDMTPRAFLGFVAEARGLRGRDRRRQVDRVAEQVSLSEVMHKPIDNLSKGFKRRVGIAQAIVHDPEVLILDEPTDGLDPNQKQEMRALIQSMAKDKVIVLSTHILEEVDAVCTRAIIIAAGRIISDSTPAELVARSPHHNAVTLSLVDAEAGTLEALQKVAGVAGVEALSSP